MSVISSTFEYKSEASVTLGNEEAGPYLKSPWIPLPVVWRVDVTEGGRKSSNAGRGTAC